MIQEIWAATTSTADLFWYFHNGQASLRVLRTALLRDDPPPTNVDDLEEAELAERFGLALIAAELRHRGERVEWGE